MFKGSGVAASRGAASQERQLALCALATVVFVLVTGWLVEMSLQSWLVFGLGASLVLWVGGAVSGQVLLARLLDRASGQQVLDYLRQLLWIIPRMYVPLGFVALGCGLALVATTGTTFTQPAVIGPLALYLLTAVAGAAVSAPGYVRLIRLAETQGPDDPAVRRRLLPLAWVNRVELALVIGVGFVLLASLA